MVACQRVWSRTLTGQLPVYSCQILSVDGACLSLVTFVVSTPVKTILELFTLHAPFGVLSKTGDAEPVDRSKPGCERLRTICARSISAWRRQGGVLWIDRHGVNSWRRLRVRLTGVLLRERERERERETAAVSQT